MNGMTGFRAAANETGRIAAGWDQWASSSINSA